MPIDLAWNAISTRQEREQVAGLKKTNFLVLLEENKLSSIWFEEDGNY